VEKSVYYLDAGVVTIPDLEVVHPRVSGTKHPKHKTMLTVNPIMTQKKGSMLRPPASLVRHLPSFCRHQP